MQTTTKANENPLFPIARTKQREQYKTNDYWFLEDSEGNENTYILGFCGGVSYATEQMQAKITELENKIKEMEAPTLHRQNVEY